MRRVPWIGPLTRVVRIVAALTAMALADSSAALRLSADESAQVSSTTAERDAARGAVTITALGMGAVRISGGGRTVYVDAFLTSHPIAPLAGSDADVILVTHDHADHFDAGATAAAAKKANAVVVGPASIAFPLLATHALPAGNLRILYEQNPNKAAHTEVGGIGISSYASRHFFDGEEFAIHNSYVVTLQGRRILVAGDSVALSQTAEELRHVDALLWNFVIPDKDLARVSELAEALRVFEPKVLFPVHLIGCDWTVRPGDLRAEIARRRLGGVVVLDENDRSRRLEGEDVR